MGYFRVVDSLLKSIWVNPSYLGQGRVIVSDKTGFWILKCLRKSLSSFHKDPTGLSYLYNTRLAASQVMTMISYWPNHPPHDCDAHRGYLRA